MLLLNLQADITCHHTNTHTQTDQQSIHVSSPHPTFVQFSCKLHARPFNKLPCCLVYDLTNVFKRAPSSILNTKTSSIYVYARVPSVYFSYNPPLTSPPIKPTPTEKVAASTPNARTYKAMLFQSVCSPSFSWVNIAPTQTTLKIASGPPFVVQTIYFTYERINMNIEIQ